MDELDMMIASLRASYALTNKQLDELADAISAAVTEKGWKATISVDKTNRTIKLKVVGKGIVDADDTQRSNTCDGVVMYEMVKRNISGPVNIRPEPGKTPEDMDTIHYILSDMCDFSELNTLFADAMR